MWKEGMGGNDEWETMNHECRQFDQTDALASNGIVKVSFQCLFVILHRMQSEFTDSEQYEQSGGDEIGGCARVAAVTVGTEPKVETC